MNDDDTSRLCWWDTIGGPELVDTCERLALVLLALTNATPATRDMAEAAASRALQAYAEMQREHHQRGYAFE